MSDSQPSDRSAGAYEITGAVRREARTTRQNQARYAQLLFGSYGWERVRIAEALDLTTDVVSQLLAVDGIQRCVDCSFGFHRSCMGDLNFNVESRPARCECGCSAAV